MTPSDWSRIKVLLHEALARPLEERAAFLDHVCEKEDLRREVEDAVLSDTPLYAS